MKRAKQRDPRWWPEVIQWIMPPQYCTFDELMRGRPQPTEYWIDEAGPLGDFTALMTGTVGRLDGIAIHESLPTADDILSVMVEAARLLERDDAFVRQHIEVSAEQLVALRKHTLPSGYKAAMDNLFLGVPVVLKEEQECAKMEEALRSCIKTGTGIYLLNVKN